MLRAKILAFFCAAILVGSLYGVSRYREMSQRGLKPRTTAPVLVESASHAVSPRMADSSRAMVGQKAEAFSRSATDGRIYGLTALLRSGPVVLTFTKVGCPCSEAAQPFFNQIAAAYPRVSILGVVNAESGPASLWTRRLNAAYPHLLDPDLTLVQAFGVENSAYVVVIDTRGQIVGHWPGISQQMLRELGQQLSRSTRTPEVSLELVDAPDQLYSGCPFDLPPAERTTSPEPSGASS